MMGLADSAQLHVLLLTSGIGTALVLASMIGRGLKIRVAKRQPHEAIDNLNTRVNAWWVIAAVIGLALLAGRVGVALLFAYASFVALREFTAGMARQRGHAPLLAASLLVAVPLQYVFVSTGHYGIYTTFIPIYAFVALPTLALALHDPRDPAPRLASLQWGLMLCVFGVSHVAALFALDVPGYEGRNAFLVAYLLVVVQASDVLQYIWGKLAGRLRIAPRWSPAKTVEGTLGGVLSATLLGALLSPITPFSLAEATLVSLAITLLGVLGGLLMSAEKRRRGLKDWGTLIKGHGGVLDRLDSLCLSAPVFYYIVRCGFGA